METQFKDLLDDTLQHAGVKGMKWGVIRSLSAKYAHGMVGLKKKAANAKSKMIEKAKTKTVKKASKAKGKDKVAPKPQKKKDPSTMTNEELKVFHEGVITSRRLQSVSKSPYLDNDSKAQAKALLAGYKAGLVSHVDYKIAESKLSARARMLEESRPSYQAKIPKSYEFGLKAVQTLVLNKEVMGRVLSAGVSKATKGNAKGLADGVKKAIGQNGGKSANAKLAKFAQDSILELASTSANRALRSSVERSYKRKLDRKAGFK